MYANNLEQLISFGYFIGIGAILGIIFDFFRIFRRTIKTLDIITNIQDILFCFITGIIILLSIFYFNNGELRLYIFLGITIGITTYMLLVSKYFIKVCVSIINFIKKFLYFFTRPFVILINTTKKIIFRPISFIIINLKGFVKKLQKNLKIIEKR